MTRRARVVVGGIPFFFVALFLARPHALGDSQIVNVYNVAVMAGATAVTIGVWRSRPQPRWPWVLIALCIALWAVGDVVYSAIGTEPALSVADAFYLVGYLPLVLGAVWLVRTETNQGRGDSFLDLAIVAVAATYAGWVFAVEPTWAHADTSGAARFVVVSYPVLDAALLVLVAGLLFARGRSTSVVFFALGMAVVFAGDLAYTVASQNDSFLGSPLLDATWPLGYALVGLAAVHPPRWTRRSRLEKEAPFHLIRILAAAAALFVVPLAAAVSQDANGQLQPVPLLVASGAAVVLVLWRVVRLQRHAEAANAEVERSERYFRALAMNSSDAYAVIAEDGTVTDTTAELENVIGWSRDATVGQAIAVLVEERIDPEDAQLAASFLERARRRSDRSPVVVELRLSRPDGRYGWIEVHATNLVDDPAVRGVVLNFHDIDVRKRAEAELAHQAFHDPLTRLANRALLRDRVEQALARNARSGGTVAVLFCDLDGFKTVNDTMGHEAGDELLQNVAARLVSAARNADTVARLGGDEFAVVIEGRGEVVGSAANIAERALRALSEPIEIAQTPMIVTAKIGVALTAASRRAANAVTEELLRRADVAMYDAKAAGGNRYSIYSPEMGARTVNQFLLTRELSEAMGRNEFVVHYQPVVKLDTWRLTGFEALIRWQHPTRGLLAPSKFVPAAERSGAIVEIGRWILLEACMAATRWPFGGDAGPLTVAVNVAAAQVGSAGFVGDVTTALRESGLDPRRLVLEITESTLIAHPDVVEQRLSELRRLGVRIAIDDFGTGYSSLNYLQQFPVDILKVDRSFVESIETPDRMPAVIRGLFDLGRTLGLEMVAEGIETPAQRACLANEAGLLGQGFLFSRAVTLDEAIALADTMLRDPVADRSG